MKLEEIREATNQIRWLSGEVSRLDARLKVLAECSKESATIIVANATSSDLLVDRVKLIEFLQTQRAAYLNKRKALCLSINCTE